MRGNETGVTLIETLVALALLSIIAVVFLGGLTTVATATLIANEQATAESLARSQMEYVKSQGYIDYTDPEHEEYVEFETVPVSYSVDFTVETIDDPDTGQPLEGIQKITVIVSRNDDPVLTLEGYKVAR